MPYPYRTVTLTEKEIGRIAGNAGAHADLMTNDLTERWRSLLPKGQKVINLKQVQLCVRHDLRGLRRQIVEIESEHMEELEADLKSRLERDDNRPKLREKLIGIQGLLESTYGGGSSAKVFGPDVVVIPTDAFPLRRVGKTAHKRLMSPELALGTPRIPGVEISPTALAKSFEEPLKRLEEVLVGLEDTLPLSNQSLEKKMRKLRQLRTEAGIAARFLEALYYLAGHDIIAERVRPSSHLSRRSGAGGEEATDEAVSAEARAPQTGAPQTGAPETGAPETAGGDQADAEKAFPFEPAADAGTTIEGKPAGRSAS